MQVEVFQVQAGTVGDGEFSRLSMCRQAVPTLNPDNFLCGAHSDRTSIAVKDKIVRYKNQVDRMTCAIKWAGLHY